MNDLHKAVSALIGAAREHPSQLTDEQADDLLNEAMEALRSDPEYMGHTALTAVALFWAHYSGADDSRCDECGGEMAWCEGCNMYTATCCEQYGSCMCS